MRCYGCASKFGWVGSATGKRMCPGCGHAFCLPCFTNKEHELRLDGVTWKRYCKWCFTAHHGPGEVVLPCPIPKGLEAAGNPATPLITGDTSNDKAADDKQGSTDRDTELHDRLQKLREEKIAMGKIVTVEEIERRLALLRDQNPDIVTQKPPYQPPDSRTQQEQSDDLLNQASEELKLLRQLPHPEDEIEKRLRKLRGGDSSAVGNLTQHSDGGMNTSSHDSSLDEIAELLMKSGLDKTKMNYLLKKGDSSANARAGNILSSSDKADAMNDSSDEESAAKAIISKAVNLAKLEQDRGMELDDDDSDGPVDQDELPWCCICNEDATRRCIDCDKDLYCEYCFRMGHKDLEMRSHQSVPFNKKEK